MKQTVRQYLVELEQQNPTEEPLHEQKLVSTTDPDATYATKGGTPARLGYYDNYLVDNHNCVIVGVQATAARMSQETVAAQAMIARFAEWQGREPESVVADATYGNGEFLQLVNGAGDHTVYAHPGQSSAQEQPTLRSRAFYLSSPKQQLSLSGWRTAQLCRPECSRPRSRLYRQWQALWGMVAKGAMHKWAI